MINNKTDLRVVKTEKSIRAAFVELIVSKGYKNIKIKDICDKAEINRNTFYLHYNSKEDLVDSIVDELTEQFLEDAGIKNRKFLYYNDKTMEAMFVALLNNLESNKKVLKAVANDQSLSGYLDKFMNAIKDTMMHFVDFSQFRSRIAVQYSLSGIVGVIDYWLSDDRIQTNDVATECARLSMIMIHYAQ